MPDLERVQQNTPLTLSQPWYEDGAAVDPGTVTVGITRADGTVLVAAATATSGSGTSPRTFNLTTTHTALLDRLKVTWTSTLKGTLVSYVEVVGGFLFGIAELRALGLSDTTTYPTSAILTTRIRVEQQLEDRCSRAFVPRYELESVAPGQGTILLRNPDVTAIRSVTQDAVAVTPTSSYTWISGGIGYVNTGRYATTAGDLVVGYEYGMTTLKEPVRAAALAEAQQRLTLAASGTDPRIESFSTDDGTVRYGSGGTAGFVSAEANQLVADYDMSVGVA